MSPLLRTERTIWASTTTATAGVVCGGREYALVGFKNGSWRLYSGTASEVYSIGANPDIIRRMHTHPGIGKGAAMPSLVDAKNHLVHRQGGGKGALEVISRLEDEAIRGSHKGKP